ncbi:MAG: hypothetical protein M3Q08_01515 [Pseudomonadota bacterium]|nr:hypothetical protein [Pseudomonadota bacterium]
MLEPEDGGDHQLMHGADRIVEQMKIRSAQRAWSTGEVAREVLTDLIKANAPGKRTAFRFVTNNARGLAALQRFLETWRDREARPLAMLPWGRRRLSFEEFGARLAAEAGTDMGDPTFRSLLDNLEIVIVDAADAEAEIVALLRPVLAPGQSPEAKREELVARLLKAASEGRRLDAADLLALIHPEAYLRLGHVLSLPAILRQRLEADCRGLGYDASAQARLRAPEPSGPITIFSGEPGQGKTWSLCQSARTMADRGGLAVAVSAPGSIERLIQEINDRVWLPAHRDPAALQVIARTLAPALAGDEGYWLTVFVDDVQDRGLAEEIGRADWQRFGVRLVLSAQPRITVAIGRLRSDLRIERIESFTSSELRRYLRHHGREQPLETMPDDVFELLLKPIHARIFIELPARRDWTGATEYELFQAYWRFAGRTARSQYDHPGDREGLVALAGSLLRERPRYPWRVRDMRAADLDDEAVKRLEQVGLLRWLDEDRLAFASDRMLNWAVAESLSARIADEHWPPARADQELDAIKTIVTAGGELVGRRLGYVFLDAIWILTREAAPDYLADLLLARLARLPQEWRGEQMWANHLATVGSGLLPALERLVLRDHDEERDYDIPANIPRAIAGIALSDRDAVAASVQRLIASGVEAGADAAIQIARRVPLPEALDWLWAVHMEREIALANSEAGQERKERGDRLRRREVSSQAVKTAVRAASSWLEGRLAATSDPFELNQLLWLLQDKNCVGDGEARELWTRHRAHLLRTLCSDSRAMVSALAHFADTDSRAWLDAVPLTQDDWMSSRVLRARARIDPATALQQIRDRHEDYGWSAATWWLPELARADPAGLSQAIRENASKGEHPLTDVILYYAHFPELIDEPTLEWVLDEFAVELNSFGDEAGEIDDHLGRLHHSLRFLPTLPEAWQFECLARRAGTSLEQQLVRLGSRRRGRTSRLRDTEGGEIERVLAMIGGSGYDQLVVAELGRSDPFGREDGYSAAHWTGSPSVTTALRQAREDAGLDSYREVMRMEALAIHQCDAELEAMVRANSPIYVNAAEMRSAEGRPTAALQRRVEELVASGNEEEMRVGAQLAGFLHNREQARALLPVFLRPETSERVRRAMLGTFRALDLYDPSLLPVACELMRGRIDDEGHFVASYLAAHGDAAARRAVADWLSNLDLGTWSSARDAFLCPLLEHEDSRAAVVDFLRRSRGNGHLLIDGFYLRVLAETGEVEAQEALLRSAYREPRFGGHTTVTGIDYLRTVDPDEAFFAARRYLARQEAPDAIELMLRIDLEAAVPMLIARCREAKPSLLGEIARRLRAHLPPDRQKGLLDGLAVGRSAEDRLLAAGLAGWMPSSLELDWLDHFADTGTPALQAIARSSLRSRGREAAAMAHLQAMPAVSKPGRWARLHTVFECVDPYFLWSRNDPASLQEFLDANPPEFVVEARQLRSRRGKEVGDQAKKADRER